MFNLRTENCQISLLKVIVLEVSLGEGVYVETAHLDESGRLLSIRSADIFEMLAKSGRVIAKSVADFHIQASRRM